MQQYYNKLVKSSKTGVFPSLDEYGGCQYRANEKRSCKQRCAIGILIPDKLYMPSLEGSVSRLLRTCPEIRNYFPDGLTPRQATCVQFAHDNLAESLHDESWDHDRFVKRLNGIRCFAKVKKVKVSK